MMKLRVIQMYRSSKCPIQRQVTRGTYRFELKSTDKKADLCSNGRAFIWVTRARYQAVNGQIGRIHSQRFANICAQQHRCMSLFVIGKIEPSCKQINSLLSLKNDRSVSFRKPYLRDLFYWFCVTSLEKTWENKDWAMQMWFQRV